MFPTAFAPTYLGRISGIRAYLHTRFTRSKGTLSERDRKLIWHPFTQEKTAGDPIPIKRGRGSYVYDERDRPYLDLVSSWWVNILGHGHPEIADAIYKQATTLEHVIFAGFTHEPAVSLCESLTQVLPPYLRRFYFSDDGSTAVEVALKMAYQYWVNHGEGQRKNFLCFDGGYHGDTFGAMAVSRGSGYHDAFGSLLFQTLMVPFPATWEGDAEVEKKEDDALAVLERHLAENLGQIGAIILEPLIQGASGMRVCRTTFQERVIETVRQHSGLIIFDEVMTGFGRTGTLFALNKFKENCQPDFLCISKGITGGFLPLALTVTTEEIYGAFLGNSFSTAFAHGHSYTGNPIACAAAVKSLEILTRPQTQEAIKSIQQAQADGLAELCTNLGKEVATRPRKLGTIAAFEIGGRYDFHLNLHLKKAFVKEGLILRPLGNNLYVLPPYSTTPAEILDAYHVISKILKNLDMLK